MLNALLIDYDVDINENYILPKSCVLLVLRFLPTEIIQADEEDCKEQNFVNGVHCLRTSTYDPWVHWDEKKVEVYTKKASKLPPSTNIARAAPDFVPDLAAPCDMNKDVSSMFGGPHCIGNQVYFPAKQTVHHLKT